MCFRLVAIVLFGAAVALATSGCKREPAVQEKPAPAAPPTPAIVYHTLARVHWLGKERLSNDTNAANVLSALNIPESLKLKSDLLDKLSTAPWRMARVTPEPGDTNVTGIFRPLLEDIFSQEAWLEVRQATNQPPEVALALRLDENGAARWQTNLAFGIEKLAGSSRVDTTNGWSLQASNFSRIVEFTRQREWILVGLSAKQGTFLPEVARRISERGSPVVTEHTNEWFQAELDVPRLADMITPGVVPAGFPRVTFGLYAEEGIARTRGDFIFPAPLSLQLDQWEVPTNYIRQPLIGFTALRGMAARFGASPFWRAFTGGPAPNQAFAWTLEGIPFTTYAIAPLLEATNTFAAFSQFMLTNCNPWLRQNSFGQLQASDDLTALSWINLPVINPTARIVETNGTQYVLAGILPPLPQLKSFPGELLDELSRHTNIVCYDWELTGAKLGSVLSIAQVFRVFFKLPQFSKESTPLNWVKALAPRLGNCATALTQVAPDRLSFKRKSTIGFSAVELYLLCDWLDSPDFPAGLLTTRGKKSDPFGGIPTPPAPVRDTPSTNTPASTGP